MNKTNLLFLLLMILLPSCASRHYKTRNDIKIEIPSSWQSAKIGQKGDSWWTDYLDDEVLDYLNEIIEHNFDLQSARTNIETAYANLKFQSSGLLPNISLGGDASRQNRVFVGFPIPGNDEGEVASSIFNSFAGQLNVSWELDLWGKLSARRQNAKLKAEESEYLAYGMYLSLISQSLKLHAEYSKVSSLYELSKERLQIEESLLAWYEKRYQKGLETRQILRDREAAYHQAVVEKEKFFRQKDLLVKSLEIMAGRYPRGELSLPISVDFVQTPAPAGIPSDLMEKRPDIIAAEKRLLAVNQTIREQYAKLFPSINLTASGGRTSDELRNLSDNNFNIWSLASGIIQPVFQGGAIKAGLKAAKSESERELLAYSKKVLEAFYEVETALTTDSSLLRQTESLEKLYSNQELKYEADRNRYLKGVSSKEVLAISQLQKISSQSELILSKTELYKNRIDLHLALGGSFDVLRPNQLVSDNEKVDRDLISGEVGQGFEEESDSVLGDVLDENVEQLENDISDLSSLGSTIDSLDAKGR